MSSTDPNSTALTPPQRWAWFLHGLYPGKATTTLSAGVPVEADDAALTGAIQKLTEAHQALSLTFSGDGADPRQRLTPAAPEVVWLDRPQGDARASEAQALLDQEANAALEVGARAPVRWTVVRYPGRQRLVILTANRLVLDRWSLELLLGRLAESLGGASATPAEAVGFLQHAAKVATLPRPELSDHHRALFAEDPVPLQLPEDLSSETPASALAGKLDLRLEPTVSRRLLELAREQGCTPRAVLLAGWLGVLSRYSGVADPLVGVWCAKRLEADAADRVGSLATRELLRPQVALDAPLFALAKALEPALTALEHLPTFGPTEWLEAVRTLGADPQFELQVGFAFDTLRHPAITRGRSPGALVERLFLDGAEREGALEGTLYFNPDRFSPGAAQRIADHLGTLLAGAAATPQTALGRLPLLTDEERARILVEWNKTEAPRPARCIHELFEDQAARTPDQVAVTAGSASWRYRELDAAANRIAHALIARGVGPETRVLVGAGSRLELIAALLGVLKSGGAYVPVDPESPLERLKFVARTAETQLALVDASTEPVLAGLGLPLLRIDQPAQWADQPATSPRRAVSPRNLAYVVFTSGSTGEPKGVLVEHASVVNHSLAISSRLGLGAKDVVLQFTPVYFDAAGEEIYPPLFSGGTIAMQLELLGPADFTRFVDQAGITLLSLPPAFMIEWAADLRRRQATLPASLRAVLLGGEKLLPETLAEWEAVGGARVPWFNVYGPTEATITSAICEIRAGSGGLKRRSLPIGRPIENARLYVLDERGEPVPAGVTGELFIGGAGLARGYVGRPDLTAERFVPDPFAASPGGRLYRTGDLVRHLPDGQLEFVGRTDHQIKIRGMRVEVGEIESRLREHAGVEQVVVVPQDVNGQRRLVAYLVPKGGQTPAPAELRAFTEATLPSHMVPSAFVSLEKLPLTSAMKVDVRALPAPTEEAFGKTQAHVAAGNDTEAALAEIFAEVLGAERVGVNDDFFELGGESLSAMNVAAQAGERLGVDLSVVDVLENPSVGALAKAIEERIALSGPRNVDDMSDDEVEAMLADLSRRTASVKG